MNDRMKVRMNERMTVVCMCYYLNGNKHIKEKKREGPINHPPFPPPGWQNQGEVSTSCVLVR
jgi:hypothetical protein